MGAGDEVFYAPKSPSERKMRTFSSPIHSPGGHSGQQSGMGKLKTAAIIVASVIFGAVAALGLSRLLQGREAVSFEPIQLISPTGAPSPGPGLEVPSIGPPPDPAAGGTTAPPGPIPAPAPPGPAPAPPRPPAPPPPAPIDDGARPVPPPPPVDSDDDGDSDDGDGDGEGEED